MHVLVFLCEGTHLYQGQRVYLLRHALSSSWNIELTYENRILVCGGGGTGETGGGGGCSRCGWESGMGGQRISVNLDADFRSYTTQN